MITDKLFDEVLMNPVVRDSARELLVVSGYATPAMVHFHREQIARRLGDAQIRIRLIVGMTLRDGISCISHLGFQRLESDNFVCSYIFTGKPVHSKVYIWLPTGRAFAGSANYTQKGFSGDTHEILMEVDDSVAEDYFHRLTANTISCKDQDVARRIRITKTGWPNEAEAEFSGDTIDSDLFALNRLKRVTLSLLKKNGTMPEISGLNWGQREGRNPNQAYLAIRRNECPEGFFPPRYRHLTIMTDDGKIFDANIAQQEGKAIHTPDNTEFGRYFRQRLHVKSGEIVTRRDLENYGRFDVDFYKVDPETFFMDFSV